MALTAAERDEVKKRSVQQINSTREAVAALKAEYRAAIDTADDWWDTNQPAYFTAITQNLTNRQKVRLLYFILKQRLGV